MAVHNKLNRTWQEAVAKTALEALKTSNGSLTENNGTICVTNADGTLTIIGSGAGTDSTGTSVSISQWVGDTTPPGVPTGVSFFATGYGTITGTWDGTLDGGVPSDFRYVAFRVDGVEYGTLTGAGDCTTTLLESDQTYSMDAVAYDYNGNVSDPCDFVDVQNINVYEQYEERMDELEADAEALKESVEEEISALNDAANAAQASADAAATAASELASTVSDVQTTVTDLATTVTATAETADAALELATSVETSLEGFEVTVSETYATKTELSDVSDVADSAQADATSALEQVSTLSVTVEGVSATASSAYTTATEALTNAATAQATADAITTKVTEEYTTTADLETMLGDYVTDTTLSATLENYSTTTETAEMIASEVSSALYTTDEDGNETAIYATASEVEQTSTEILSTVSATYATVDSLSDYATVDYVDEGDDVTIGGRNLLPDTRDFSTWSYASTYVTETDDEGYGIVVFPDADSLSWRNIPSRNYGDSTTVLPYSLVRGKTVTFGVDVMVPGGEVGTGISSVPFLGLHVTSGTSDTSRDVYRSFYSTDIETMWGISADADDLTSWQRATYTFTITDDLFTSGSIDEFGDDCGFGITLYAYTTYEVRYRKPKLEIGDVATDWTPAPEDAETYTDSAVSTATTTITAAYTSAIEQSAESITSTVSATYLTVDDAEETYATQAVVEQTQELISTAVESALYVDGEEVYARQSYVEQQDDAITAELTTVAEMLDSEIETRQAYMTFTQDSDGDPLLILGASDNDLKAQLSNDALEFIDGDEVVAYISNQQLYISTAEVTNLLQIGNFAWVPRANGNLTLMAVS